jgi:hypothetical protein
MLAPSFAEEFQPMRPSKSGSMQDARLLAAAAMWLIVGGFLLLSTLVPAHTAMLGWTPAFWLVVAPLLALLSMANGRRDRSPSRRRRTAVAAIWN